MSAPIDISSYKKGGDWLKPCISCGRHPHETKFNHGRIVGIRIYRKSRCSECCMIQVREWGLKNKERLRAREKARSRDWHKEIRYRWAKDPEAMRRYVKNRNTQMKFGISVSEYEKAFRDQGPICPICNCGIVLEKLGRDGLRAAHLDHDHENGRIRSFLCDRCNVMIGMSVDSPETLRAAALYLEKHNAL